MEHHAGSQLPPIINSWENRYLTRMNLKDRTVISRFESRYGVIYKTTCVCTNGSMTFASWTVSSATMSLAILDAIIQIETLSMVYSTANLDAGIA